jgi:hypothetical protein
MTTRCRLTQGVRRYSRSTPATKRVCEVHQETFGRSTPAHRARSEQSPATAGRAVMVRTLQLVQHSVSCCTQRQSRNSMRGSHLHGPAAATLVSPPGMQR